MELYEYLMVLALFLVAIAMALLAVYEIQDRRRSERVMHNFNMFVSGMTPQRVSVN